MQPNRNPNPETGNLKLVEAWPYIEAAEIAQRYLTLFEPLCFYAAIAGSIRRQRSHVNDLEIVVCPHRQPEFKITYPVIKKGNLFEHDELISEGKTEMISNDPVPGFIDLVNSWQKMRGEPTGRATQRVLPERIMLDLFIPQESDFFRILAMRTGSADFSKNVIARTWVMNGWRGTADGLRLEHECINKGDKYVCFKENPTLPPAWKSEIEFFEWLGLKWCPPEHRY